MLRKTKKMEDEIVDLKSVSGKYTNNNNDKSNLRKNHSSHLSIVLK